VPALGAALSETSASAPSAAGQSQQARLGLIARSTALLGAKVRDRSDSSVGRMEDILVGLSAGQAVAALFSFGSDDKLMLVPAPSFLKATKSKVLVNADKKTLKGAPCFARTELSLGLEPDCLSRSFDCFHQELPKATAADPGRLLCAAAII
jgi:hypothetical protein